MKRKEASKLNVQSMKGMRLFVLIFTVIGLLSLLVVTGCEMDSIYLESIEEKVESDLGSSARYGVTYYGNGEDGGTAPTDETLYAEGQSVTVKGQGTLSLTGSTFTGWNTQEDGEGTPYVVDSSFPMPASNVDLYAQWTTNPTYTVTYVGTNATGGSAPTDPNNYEENDLVTVADPAVGANPLYRNGYTFSGWNTHMSGDGTTRIAGSTFQIGTENVTLYAQWSLNTYNIFYNLNSGANHASNPGSYTILSSTITLQPPSRSGYTFGGWYNNEGFSGSAITQIASGTTGHITLYAKWSVNSYKITFDKNDVNATGSMVQQSIPYGSTVNLLSCGYSKAGWIFSGWAITSGGSVVYANQDNFTMGASNITLYAKWTAQTYSISFNGNDIGATGAMSNQNIQCGSSANLKSCSFSKTGWSFAGWALSAGGSVVYSNQQVYTMGPSNITLYARWTAPTDYSIGDRGPAGGWIFYDKGNSFDGWRYLEAAPWDQSSSCYWGSYGILISDNDRVIGSGSLNTQRIVTEDSFINKAADYSDVLSLTNGGTIYNDWFLPSRDELNEMYTNIRAIGGFDLSGGSYWSSTQGNSYLAYRQRFSDGFQNTNQKDYWTFRVRSVRAF